MVVNKNVGNHTLAGLRALREERSLCDVIIKVEGREIRAHRCILAINSDYFKAMFLDGFHETKVREIELDSLEGHAAETLVEYMYTGHFTLSAENVQNLIMVADQWQMSEVKDMCVEFMERQITTENCLGVLEFSEVYRCESLYQKSQQLIKQRFPIVAKTYEFLTLSAQRLGQILSYGDLFLGFEGEDVVLEAITRWMDHNTPDRIDDMAVLLQKVRLTNTTKDCRRRLLEENVTVQENPELMRIIQQQMQEPVHGRTAKTSLYVVGGFRQFQTGPTCPRLKGVERLDPDSNSWTKCADLPILSSGSFAFNLYGHLFCVAYEPVAMRQGAAAIATETSIFEYNVLNDEWVEVKENFSEDAFDSIDNCLQAAGDVAVCPQTNTLYTVSNSEVASISATLREGTVSCVQRKLLPKPHRFFSEKFCYHSAVVLNECLYVIGGDARTNDSENVPTNLVIMFDPLTNTWVQKASLIEARAKLDAVVLDGCIYACGGFNSNRLATMERYDPLADTWTPVVPMVKFRSHHRILVMDKKIIAMGGKSISRPITGAKMVQNSCEVFEPAANQWTEGPPMKSARCGFAAVAV